MAYTRPPRSLLLLLPLIAVLTGCELRLVPGEPMPFTATDGGVGTLDAHVDPPPEEREIPEENVQLPASAESTPVQPEDALLAEGETTLRCTIVENGHAGRGRYRVYADAAHTELLAAAECYEELVVPSGALHVEVELSEAVGAPARSFALETKPLDTVELAAEFETGLLSVQLLQSGEETPGMAIIRQDGAQLGTIATGMVWSLEVGTYEVEVWDWRSGERRTFADVAIVRGEREGLRVRLP